MNIGSPSQPTDFTLDVLGRYTCNTFDEALANSDASYRSNARDLSGNALPPRGDMRPFDFIVIGGGTFGGAVAEQLFYRSTGRSERILVLEGGPFLLPEHWQNLPSMSLGGEVWGVPWNSNTNDFAGLAFCIGGRSIFWGGWSPRLLDSETVTWPQAVLDDLNAKKLANGDAGYFRQSGQQIGVTETNDYIFGDLHNALRDVLFDAIESDKISDAMKLSTLPEAPPVEILDTPPTLTDLAAMLGIPLPNPLPADVAKLEKKLRNKLKLEAPLAVQARSGHAGFFPMNKFSTTPLLIKAARSAVNEAPGDDVNKRLMIVARCHVQRLNVVNEAGSRRLDAVITERGPVPVSPDCQVIIALGTIESTRLALLSFGEDGRIGTNLIAHLRSNIDFRVPRAALAALPSSVKALQASALLLKGQHQFKKPDGTPDGVGHFHFQITATGLDDINTNSEAELFQKIPDVDTVLQHLHADDSHVVITIRGIGEMEPRNPASNVTRDLNPAQTDYNERRAYVNLKASAKDMELWETMDKASDELAAVFANGQKVDIIARNKSIKAQGVDAATYPAVVPHQIKNAAGLTVNNPERRDGLGTTHHEAGTLRMGDNPSDSVTDVNCRLHGVKNTYVVGPALFPSTGSPNPMLTGIALARRLGDHLLPPPPQPQMGIAYLFDGKQKSADFFAAWKMAGGGKFRIVGRSLIAQPGSGGIGLLYYTGQQFDNFTLRLDFCLPHPRGNNNDNSGVFVRFRDPRKPVLPGTPGPDVPGNDATVAVDTGYEIQIDEEARGDTRKKEPDGTPEQDGHFYNHTGAIYKVKAAGAAPGQQNYTNSQKLAAGIWHSYEIKVVDRTYTVKLNNEPATAFVADPADANEKFRGRKKSEDPDSGFIGLQVHTGKVAFANIRIE
jgi:choline dehydrogenase-like flavoprotein